MMTREQFEELRQSFDKVVPQLECVIERMNPEYGVKELRDGVLSGVYQLWVKGDNVCITEVVDHSTRRVVMVHVVVGNLGEILEEHDYLIKFARKVEAERIELMGRSGWTKILKSYGWKTQAIQMYREV